MSDAVATTLAQRLRASLPSRFKAAGIHLSLSLVIFAVALYLILAHWYPMFHFAMDGGWRGVRIMAGVDLVLGPSLTLIIFNPLKQRHLLIFDLVCIGLAQTGALAWGFYAVHSQHPVALTYYDGKYHSVIATPIEEEKYPLTWLETLSDRKPALIYVRPPANDDEQARLEVFAMLGGAAEHEDPLRFEKYAPHWDEVKKHALDRAKEAKDHKDFDRGLGSFLSSHGGSADDYLYFPFSGRDGECTIAVSKDGEPLGAIRCSKY